MKNAILLLTVFAVLVTACKDPFWLEDNKKSEDKVRTLDYLVVYNSNHNYQNSFNDRETFVLKSQSELDEFLSQLTPTTIPTPEMKEIDFNDKMLIGIALPAQSSGSHRLRITDLKMVGGVIEVSSQLTIPNIGTDDIGYPMFIVEVDKHSEEVKFLETEIIREGDMDLSYLLNKHWELSNIVEENGNIINPNKYNGQGTNGQEIDLDPFTIQFKDDYSFSGHSNCNNYGGEFSLSGSELSILELWSTEAACPLSDFYQTLLRNAVSIDYSAQKYITITSEYNGKQYILNYFHFIPELDNLLEGSEWIFESYSTDGGITFEDYYIDENGEKRYYGESLITLNFANGSAFGTAVCEDYSTIYTTNPSNQSISINPYQSNVNCSINLFYLGMLAKSTRYEIQFGGIDRLILYDNTKNVIMVFQYQYGQNENILTRNQEYTLFRIGYINPENNRIEKQISAEDKGITIKTFSNYEFSGKGVCNDYTGKFYNHNSSNGLVNVSFTNVIVDCPDEFETTYRSAMFNVTNYSVDGEFLRLFSYKPLEYNYLVFKRK